MKKAQLSGSLRANVGKKDAKALRNAGMVPCVLYGQGEQTHFSVRRVDVEKLIFSPDVYQVEIDIDGNKKNAIIQELQMHPVKDSAMHVDFLEVADDKPVRVSLPLRTTGAAIGVINGGKLRQPYRKLKVLGLAANLPEEITVDVSKLRIGQAIRVSQIPADNFEFLDPADAVVLSVKMARGAVDAGDEDEDEAEGGEGEGEGEAAAAE
jgi:large subunit ribosomal protein L25